MFQRLMDMFTVEQPTDTIVLDVYRKATSVVNSCKLQGQIKAALRYVKLANDQDLITNSDALQLTTLCSLRLQVIKINDKRNNIS